MTAILERREIFSLWARLCEVTIFDIGHSLWARFCEGTILVENYNLSTDFFSIFTLLFFILKKNSSQLFTPQQIKELCFPISLCSKNTERKLIFSCYALNVEENTPLNYPPGNTIPGGSSGIEVDSEIDQASVPKAYFAVKIKNLSLKEYLDSALGSNVLSFFLNGEIRFVFYKKQEKELILIILASGKANSAIFSSSIKIVNIKMFPRTHLEKYLDELDKMKFTEQTEYTKKITFRQIINLSEKVINGLNQIVSSDTCKKIGIFCFCFFGYFMITGSALSVINPSVSPSIEQLATNSKSGSSSGPLMKGGFGVSQPPIKATVCPYKKLKYFVTYAPPRGHSLRRNAINTEYNVLEKEKERPTMSEDTFDFITDRDTGEKRQIIQYLDSIDGVFPFSKRKIILVINSIETLDESIFSYNKTVDCSQAGFEKPTKKKLKQKINEVFKAAKAAQIACEKFDSDLNNDLLPKKGTNLFQQKTKNDLRIYFISLRDKLIIKQREINKMALERNIKID